VRAFDDASETADGRRGEKKVRHRRGG